MKTIKIDNKVSFQAGLSKRLKTKGEAIRVFAQHFFADLSLNELGERSWDELVQRIESSWRFYCAFKGKVPQVRILNADGSHLIVEIASANLPFLLDSVRMELSRLEMVLSDVQQCRLGVVRDGKQLVINDDIEANESLIRLEVEGTFVPTSLKQNLFKVLKLVAQVVDDFPVMRKQLLLWSDDGESDGADDENNQFLRWLYANNFTFLGYEEYEASGIGQLRLVPKSRFGLVRPQMSADGMPIIPSEGRLRVEKLPVRSRVHRPAYLDAVTITERKDGKLLRVCRFVGLFTATVYNQNPNEIPLVREKVGSIFSETDIDPSSHKGRELSRIVEILPREELFFSDPQDLRTLVMKIYAIQERRIVRLLVRQDDYFANCLVYMPKGAYDTELRIELQELLEQTFDAKEVEFTTYFSESVLTRTHFILRISGQKEVDVVALEKKISKLTRSWREDLQALIYSGREKEDADVLWRNYRNIFSPGYQSDYSVKSAYRDLVLIERLSVEEPLAMKLYYSKGQFHFKLIHLGGAIPLSDVIPILENLGAKTIEQHPYELQMPTRAGLKQPEKAAEVWVHDFVLELTTESPGGFDAIKRIFEAAFQAIWRGGKENDAFNRLVPAATMNYRQISLIRAYSRYFGQVQSASSQQFIADGLTRYAHITRLIFDYFDARFNPLKKLSKDDVKQLERQILGCIVDDVVNLADDRVFRGFVEMINATQRTNFYQTEDDGSFKEHISLKFLPGQISEMPEPKPAYEIFVYSPRVEGVHLRGGKIARGGLRWSDRSEDYRTEVLGLMKAQQVKNSIIVPVGAKGGFLPKQLPPSDDRDAYIAEGVACYRIFIQGLLDITDNLDKGKVVKPLDVICYDDDDSYLVVAADKGTATFSDIANEIAQKNNFWLGDAFASGGSVGYDHKAMGITARGAWRSVQQHFRELGIDVQKTPFSVVGIGDMSGDVFGNGMLQSKKICLLAAFNHLHIFVDPLPDMAKSFKERQRLFRLPRSSWSDYKPNIISTGGGVFSRAAKSIPISAEMKRAFSITANTLTPNQLILAILKSKVDLLWNGGIGTYVKGRHESHLDVADKANDPIRVNGEQLRCRVVGEGGNLGLTQLARVEYCMTGGLCFTDFIDNAGGVNCSDAEVNIKILLNQLLEKRKLDHAARSSLLRQMTDEVAEIVLESNYQQAQAINLVMHQAVKRDREYGALLRTLEEQGKLDRQLEYLPVEDELKDRRSRGQVFTSPEISVLTSYVKGDLKQQLARSSLLDEKYMRDEMLSAFPASLVKQFHKEIYQHRLHRELTATQIANGIVNLMGMNFVGRMQDETGSTVETIARVFLVSRDVFDIQKHWHEIAALDYHVEPAIQKEMMLDIIRLVRRVTRWLLRNRRRTLALENEIPAFQQGSKLIVRQLKSLLDGDQGRFWQHRVDRLVSAGVPLQLAEFVAATDHLYSVMGIVEAANRSGKSMQKVSQVFFMLGETLQLNWFSRQIHEYQAGTRWQALARETLQDDLNWQQVALTYGILGEAGNSKQPAKVIIDQWRQRHLPQVNRWLALQASMRSATTLDPATFIVGIRELLDLAQSSVGARNRF